MYNQVTLRTVILKESLNIPLVQTDNKKMLMHQSTLKSIVFSDITKWCLLIPNLEIKPVDIKTVLLS